MLIHFSKYQFLREAKKKTLSVLTLDKDKANVSPRFASLEIWMINENDELFQITTEIKFKFNLNL